MLPPVVLIPEPLLLLLLPIVPLLAPVLELEPLLPLLPVVVEPVCAWALSAARPSTNTLVKMTFFIALSYTLNCWYNPLYSKKSSYTI